MFRLEINIIFWTLVSFGIVCWVISAKIYPVLAKILKNREEKIIADLANAAEKSRAAETLHNDLAERQKNIELEAHRIISEAQEKGKRQAAEQWQVWQEEFRELRRVKEEDLRRAEEDFYRHFEERVGKMLYAACAKVLRLNLTPELQQQILQERLAELKKIKEF
ncbi:F0F1 ATP synthase subunit B [Candidatus Termititenax persephonae]|uniref:ATP synthase subunit b n=1 Tax=Candidatus Termititenax persephonae TaxID=2218525 RepID=A0A388THI1_9BACT|nr:F0F1 ATP synthase subunit B [Candidatus Termititenax persephonae]